MKNTHAKTLLLSALLLPLTACGTTVLGGGVGGGGGDDDLPSTSSASGTGSSTTGGTGSSTGSSTSPPGGGTSTIAILLADLPAVSSEAGVPIAWTGAGPAPAGALVLMWSNEPESCGAGYVGPSTSGMVWQGALVLPPELLQVGLVDLSDPGVGSFNYNYFADNGGGGGGGPSTGGMLDIVSIDATSITVNLITGFNPWEGGTDNGVTYPPVVLTGTYTIPKC